MIVGVPKEIKDSEFRVGMVPAGVHALREAGHEVLVQEGAGRGSGIEDEEYTEAGARMRPSADDVYAEADMIVKVKEPLEEEFARIRPGQVLFTYFHFAASIELTRAMLESGASCIAYETLEVGGRLPLLAPMSEVAGRLSIQEGAKYLEKHAGGRGVLLGGVPGVDPGRVLVLGGGVVGSNAARIAAGFGARVAILDKNVERLRYLADVMPANVVTLYSDRYTIRQELHRADLVVGAVLISGTRAPVLVSREDLSRLNSGAVIVDVAVDQGGCVETCKPTTHQHPTFEVDGIVHYCVANMPGAVSRTSTYALTNVTLPYALGLATHGLKEALGRDPALASAANVLAGKVTYPGVAESFGMECVPPLQALA